MKIEIQLYLSLIYGYIRPDLYEITWRNTAWQKKQLKSMES